MIGKIFLTVLLTIGSVNNSPFLRDMVHSNSTVTGYGSYYYTYTTDISEISWQLGGIMVYGRGYMTTLTYEFNKAYTGTIQISAVSQNVWNQAEVFTNNCYVIGKTGSTYSYTIGFNNVESIEINLVVPASAVITSLSGVLFGINNYNMTDGVDIEDIYSSIGIIDASTPTITTSLVNIYGASSDILTVSEASRQLLAEIVSALRGNNSLGNLLDVVNSINTQLVNQATYLQSLNIPNYAQSIYRVLSRNNYNNIQHNQYGNYVTVDNTLTFSTYLYGAGAPYCMIYAIEGTSSLSPTFTNNGVTVNLRRTMRTNNMTICYVEITNNTGSNGNYEFKLNATTQRNVYPYFLGYSRAIPYDLMWACADFYNDAYTDAIQDVVDAVNGMSVNVNNMTVNTTGIVYDITTNDVRQITNNYNNVITYVYNIENNFGYNLDSMLEGYQPIQAVNDQLIQKTNDFNGVFNSIATMPLISTILTVALVGAVLLAILG